MTWAPVLSGCQQERALRIVGTISEDLKRRFHATSDMLEHEAWSLDGRSGAALFFAYYGLATHNQDALEFAACLVEESLEYALGVAPLARLFDGLTGVAWTLAHVDGWLLDASDNDPYQAIEAALLEVTSTVPWSGEYDLLAGLTGVGTYAVERLPRPTAMELLKAVVDRLGEFAERDPLHPLWWSPAENLPAQLRRTFPGGAWNLGLAHGLPGVIALLAKAHAAGHASAGPLLNRAVEWLLAQRLLANAGSTFPALRAPDVPPRRSPLAWCYGDPGATAALFVAGRHAIRTDWETDALSIAEAAAARALPDTSVQEASICHGTAGLAHIFNRLYHATGSATMRRATEAWLSNTMDACEPGVPPEAGLLTGSSGIGLVLLAAATSVDPRWDGVLLLS
jgi:lantibiotic modifying enzyme